MLRLVLSLVLLAAAVTPAQAFFLPSNSAAEAGVAPGWYVIRYETQGDRTVFHSGPYGSEADCDRAAPASDDDNIYYCSRYV